jgi:hypothetical protein
MGAATKAERHARRVQAIREHHRLHDASKTYRINDAHASHITIWANNGLRVEWWPGTRSWADWTGARHHGEMDDLIAFLQTCPVADDGDFEVIE